MFICFERGHQNAFHCKIRFTSHLPPRLFLPHFLASKGRQSSARQTAVTQAHTGPVPTRGNPSSPGGVRGPAAPRPSAGTAGRRPHRPNAALGGTERGTFAPAAHRATGEPGPEATNPLPAAPLPLPAGPRRRGLADGPSRTGLLPAAIFFTAAPHRSLRRAGAGKGGGARRRFLEGAQRQRLRPRAARPAAARLGPASPAEAARPLSPPARPLLRPALTRKNPASILPPPPPPGRGALPSRRAPRAREPPRTLLAKGAEPGAPQRLSDGCRLVAAAAEGRCARVSRPIRKRGVPPG